MTFAEIRVEYEAQGGGWIFDLVLRKVREGYGDKTPDWGHWLELLNSFLKDQNYFEYQIKEFGREFAERQFNEFLKKIEDAYSKAMYDFSDANSKEAEMIFLEPFDLLTNEVHRTQAYYDGFETCYDSVKRERIVEADLCLKFRLELKKRLFGGNIPPSAATSTGAKEPTKKQKKALDELAKQLSEPNVSVEGAIMKAAQKADYTNDNVWKLYGKVKRGELIHKKLTVIIGTRNESD